MEAMKKPTICDNKVIAWLKLLCVPRNHLPTTVVQIESIGNGNGTENLHHEIEIGVRNTIGG